MNNGHVDREYVGYWSEKMQQLFKLDTSWADLLRYQLYYLYKNNENYGEEDISGEMGKGGKDKILLRRDTLKQVGYSL